MSQSGIRAALYLGSGAFALERTDLAETAGHAHVRVAAAGICGTDLAITADPPELDVTLPVVLGHEIFGIVESGPNAGQTVIVDPNLYCDRCAMCLRHEPTQCLNFEAIGIHYAGGFAELVAVPSDKLLPISDRVPARSAVLVEPLACVLHGLARVPGLPAGLVAILGGGPIGTLFALVLERLHGCEVIVSEPSEARRGLLAERLDRGRTVHPEELAEEVEVLTRGLGASLVVDAAGSLLDIATHICAGRGTILAFGLGDRPVATPFQQRLTWRELTVVTALTGNGCFPAAVDLIERETLTADDLVTAAYPLEEIGTAFDDARSARGLKILIEP